jgi:hypothetical protein
MVTQLLIFICMLLLPEDEAGQVLERSKTKCRLGNVGALDVNVLSLFFRLWSIKGDRNTAGQRHVTPSAAFYVMHCVLNNEPFTATGGLKSAAPSSVNRVITCGKCSR